MLKYWCALIVDIALFMAPMVISFRNKENWQSDGKASQGNPRPRKGLGLHGASLGPGKPLNQDYVFSCATISSTGQLSLCVDKVVSGRQHS